VCGVGGAVGTRQVSRHSGLPVEDVVPHMDAWRLCA
jgi:hypothetical protein